MKPASFRWLMIGFAFMSTVINYLDRQVLSVVVTAPDFKAMVPLTQEAYGYITAVVALVTVIFRMGPLRLHSNFYTQKS